MPKRKITEMERVKQYKELCGYDKETGEDNEEVFENIKNDIDNYSNSLYHLL